MAKKSDLTVTVAIPRSVLREIANKAYDEGVKFSLPLEKVAEMILKDALQGDVASEIFAPERVAYLDFLDESLFEFIDADE